MRDHSPRETKLTYFWFFLVVIAIGCSLFYPAFSSISERSPRTKAFYTVKTLLLGCRAYAADHEGVYPPSLEILYPDYIDQEGFHLVRDESGSRVPVVYHAGYKDSDDPREVLIEHPLELKRKRILGYAGGTVVEVPVK